MAAISDLITEVRTELSDDDSTRWTDAKLLNLFKKAIRRANRVIQRNGVQFGKKMAELTTVADQAYLTLSTSVTTFDTPIGLWRTDTEASVPFRTEKEWEEIIAAPALEHTLLDYSADQIRFKGTPSSEITLNLWYYPVVDPSAYTTASDTPWSGRIDDIIMEYVSLRAKNIDEMTLNDDRALLTDLETQILQAYAPNTPTQVEGVGWTGNI